MELPRWALWATSLLVATVAYFVVRLVQHRRFYRNLPGPPHDFLWGHLKLMGEMMALFPSNCHFQVAITTMAQKYNLPGLFYLDMWPVHVGFVIVTDPDLALHMTAIRNHPKHAGEGTFVDPIVGNNNIVTSDGPMWKHLHSMLSPAFATARVRGMIPLMAEEVMFFRSRLTSLAKTGEKFSLEEASSWMTFDIIGKVIFGFSLEAQVNKTTPALARFNESCHAFVIERNTWNPVTKFRARRERLTATKALNLILETLIRDRYTELETNKIDVSQKRSLSILDLVLRERLEESRTTGSTISTALSRDFLDLAITQIKTFVLAGTGTTTDSVCFIFMLLSNHPEIVQRLRAEHDKVFTPGIDETYAMLQDPDHHAKINDLEYTNNVIKEALRFYPIGNTARAQDSTGFLTFGGRQYSTEDHMICPVQHTMHYNPDIFPNPNTFDPDRYTRDESPRHAWRPFERGTRACLGQTLAMYELKVILLLTVRDFDLKCADLRPNATPRVDWCDLDLTYGDRAFQEFIFEARPRDGMPMTVSMAKS